MSKTNPKRQFLESIENELEYRSSSMTWDVDPIRKSFVYADLEVEEIEWHDDEDTPSVDCTDTDKRLTSKRNSSFKRKKSRKRTRSSEVKEDSVPSTPTNTFINKVIQQRNSSDNFSNLLDEIILRIFGLLNRKTLSRCVRVCKNWNRLGYDETFWKKVDLTNSTLAPGVLGSILHRGAVELKLKKTTVLGPICYENCQCRKTTKSYSSHGKQGCGLFTLKYLNASMYKFEKDGILPLLQKCKNLETVILKGSFVNQEEIRAIADNQALENLNLSMCEGVTSDGLTLLARNCNRLKALNVGWTNLNSNDCELIARRFSGLEELDISGMKDVMTDEVVQILTSHCKNLKSIDLSDSPLIGSASVDAIVAHNNLKKIALSRCYNMPASKLNCIAGLKNLEDLQLFGFIKKQTITDLTRMRPNLRINSELFSTIATPETTNQFSRQISMIMKTE